MNAMRKFRKRFRLNVLLRSPDLYRIDLDEVVSRYVGETETNLSRLLDSAASRGTMLFFDEADALFGKRSGVKDSSGRYSNMEFTYLLQQIIESNCPVLLGFNLPLR